MLNEEFLKNNKDLMNYCEEYKQNQMQIDCIKKVLIKHTDVPETLLNWLIDSVKANTILEFKKMNNIH